MDKGTDNWSQRATFVGFDWASDHHDVVVVDQHGKVVEDFRFDDSADGWQLLIKKLSKYPDPAVVIETSALSQLTFRVNGLQFAPCVFDFHLPIHASLRCVDIS